MERDEELAKTMVEKLQEFDPETLRRLERIQTLFDFSHTYFNKEIAELKPGHQFGELALITSS